MDHISITIDEIDAMLLIKEIEEHIKKLDAIKQQLIDKLTEVQHGN